MKKTNNSELFITMGLSWSDTTDFSARMAGDRGIFFLNADLLQRDATDQSALSLNEPDLVYRTMGQVAEKYIKQRLSIVCNGDYNQRAPRETMRQIAAKYGALCVAVWVDTPEDLLVQRIEADRAAVTKKMAARAIDSLRQIQQTLEPPALYELVICVDGAAPYEQQYNSFLAQRQNILGT